MSKVDKPRHYIGDTGIEVNEVLKDFLPRYRDAFVAAKVADAIEYLLRAPFKNGTEDIAKAQKCLEVANDYIEDMRLESV